MPNSILNEISELKSKYNEKMTEYDKAVQDHSINLSKYSKICNNKNFKFCGAQNKKCDFSGQKTVKFGNDDSSLYAYKVFTNGTNCSISAFGSDPAPGKVKGCWVATDACMDETQYDKQELNDSSKIVTQRIKELKDIEEQMRSKVKQLLAYREEWKIDFKNQEECLFGRLSRLDAQRNRMTTEELKETTNIEGKYDTLNFQIDQYITNYSLWAGITVLAGVALYVVVRKTGKPKGSGIQQPKGFNLNIGQR